MRNGIRSLSQHEFRGVPLVQAIEVLQMVNHEENDQVWGPHSKLSLAASTFKLSNEKLPFNPRGSSRLIKSTVLCPEYKMRVTTMTSRSAPTDIVMYCGPTLVTLCRTKEE
jgi:hypothetical protein